MSKLYGCMLTSFSKGKELLACVRGEGEAVAEVAGTCWLLAYCDDGVVWGRYDTTQKKWKLSSEPFPHISPNLREDNLQQLRLFGADMEVLIWRAENNFQGRILQDAKDPDEKELHPLKEKRILVGDRILADPDDDFTLVGDAGGSHHAVPICCKAEDFVKSGHPCWPLRLAVKHYLTQDQDTGVVRVTASRLVKVYNINNKRGCDESCQPKPQSEIKGTV